MCYKICVIKKPHKVFVGFSFLINYVTLKCHYYALLPTIFFKAIPAVPNIAFSHLTSVIFL